jgi:hypothetical protein
MAVKDSKPLDRGDWINPVKWRNKLPMELEIQSRLRHQNHLNIHRFMGYRINKKRRRWRQYPKIAILGRSTAHSVLMKNLFTLVCWARDSSGTSSKAWSKHVRCSIAATGYRVLTNIVNRSQSCTGTYVLLISSSRILWITKAILISIRWEHMWKRFVHLNKHLQLFE